MANGTFVAGLAEAGADAAHLTEGPGFSIPTSLPLRPQRGRLQRLLREIVGISRQFIGNT